MGNPKAKYAVSDFELQQYDLPQYEPTASAKATEAESELEPPQYEPSSSRREEDETPLVYAPDSDVPSEKKYSLWRKLLYVIIYLGVLAGIVAAIYMAITMSVSSWCIPLL